MIAQYNSVYHNTPLTFTGQKTTGIDTQFCAPDDGRKEARNTLRNDLLPINNYLLHLVGLAFICLYKYKIHGHSSIKNQTDCSIRQSFGKTQ